MKNWIKKSASICCACAIGFGLAFANYIHEATQQAKACTPQPDLKVCVDAGNAKPQVMYSFNGVQPDTSRVPNSYAAAK